jgi:hypothetical protein
VTLSLGQGMKGDVGNAAPEMQQAHDYDTAKKKR